MRTAAAFALATVLVLGGCAGGPAREQDHFATVPDACGLVPEQTAQEVVGEGIGKTGIGVSGKSSSCDWQHKENRAVNGRPYQRKLSVTATHYAAPPELDNLSGAELAHRTFESLRGGASPLSGIGDEAHRAYSGGTEKLEFRKDNVTVSVSFSGVDLDADGNSRPVNEEQAQQAATTVAKAVLGELAKQSR